jgi:hypothetical protein
MTMGNKNDGFKCDHLISRCCEKPVRFETKADGYSMTAWCCKCGTYVFTGRSESLLAFWIGDLEAVKKNKGYVPEWVEERN